MKIVELPPDLRKLDGFGGAPPHSIRFLWYGGCKTDRSTLPSRARPDTQWRLLLRGLYAPLFPAGGVRPWRIGRGGNVYCELASLRPLVIYNRSLTAQRTVIMLSANGK